MASYHYNNVISLITSGSTSTSRPIYVGDASYIAISWNSSASLGPSRITVQVSNEDGFQAALAGATSNTNWSLLTGINCIGLPSYSTSLGVGNRWLRVAVEPTAHSSASNTTVTVSAQVI